MLELLTNIETLLAIGTIASAAYASYAQRNKNATFGFLITCIFSSSLLFFLYESVISIVIAIVYVSLASLFLTMPDETTSKITNKKLITLGAITIGIVLSFVTHTPNTVISNTNNNAIFALETLVLMFFLFIFIITEIIHLHSKRP